MKMRWIPLGAGVVLVGGVLYVTVRSNAVRKPLVKADSERQQLQLTVYKQDFGMVREVRPMDLTAGSNRLHVTDVSKLLDPQSVLLQWQGEGANLPQLVAHAYDLGVENSDALLKRYVGKEVELVRYGENGHEAERQKGKLVVEGGGMVLQSDDKFIVNPHGTIVAPTNPDIIPIPQLTVQAESQAQQSTNLEVAYLTRGLSWSADYVATLVPDKDQLKLEAWATVTNRTGADYPTAKVTLIAGTPNRAVQDESRKQRDMEYKLAASKPAGLGEGPFGSGRSVAIASPEVAGEFHAYPVKTPTTIVQEQMNRLLMLSSDHVTIERDYSARTPQLYAYDYDYGYAGWGKRPTRVPVVAAVTFFNREANGLGQPLPAGSLRFYEPDASGSLRYVGAATVADTPEDEKINVTLSNSFDLYLESRLVKSQRLDKKTVRKTVEFTLHNRKKTPVTVRVVQNFGSTWKIVSEPQKNTKLDAYTAQWKFPAPADSKSDVQVTVDLKY